MLAIIHRNDAKDAKKGDGFSAEAKRRRSIARVHRVHQNNRWNPQLNTELALLLKRQGKARLAANGRRPWQKLQRGHGASGAAINRVATHPLGERQIRHNFLNNHRVG